MSRKKKRKYTLGKRLDKAYENYVKRYNAKKEELNKRGFQMTDRLLNKDEYIMNREAYIREGVTTNINQTLVSDQAYQYSLKTARHLKKFAKEHNIEMGNYSILELRQGQGITAYLSELNTQIKDMSDAEREALFAQLPDNVKHTAQGYISYEVFGSE